ncbi:hypothetical protein DFJ73DRAFT_799018 [Zopfochytrium polystomum]|nr:hypothetical protein DFJ73DRAFT_799018 [Zopfochytrium polystomum]
MPADPPPAAAPSPPPPLSLVLVGTIIHSLGLREGLAILNPGVLGVAADGRGTVVFCHALSQTPSTSPVSREEAIAAAIARLRHEWSFDDGVVTVLRKGQFVIPGFVDTHIHAPQYVFSGTGLDLPLLEWLNKYTFPRESKFSDDTYAKASYRRAVTRSLRNGTTTACYYATIHLSASKILVDVVEALGQRAFVGKVNMDRNSPDYYSETTETSFQETVEFVDYTLAKQSPLVTPVLTPRFAPSCTPELMEKLGALARDRGGLPIQSHLSENRGEIEWVKQLHPECDSYAAVYAHFGLLTDRAVMAHCIHLSPQERALLRDTGAAVSHCPNSNFSLESGVCNVRRLLDEGVKVALGTDVAGGYNPSMLDAFRMAVVASKVTAARSKEPPKTAAAAAVEGGEGKHYAALTSHEAFYLATLAGAHAMGQQDRIGNFAVGKEFDALLVDVGDDVVAAAADEEGGATLHAPVDVFPHDEVESMFEKFMYLGDDRNIVRIWVRGKEV